VKATVVLAQRRNKSTSGKGTKTQAEIALLQHYS